METPGNDGDARNTRRAAVHSQLRGCLPLLLDVAGKLAVPLAVVVAALVGYSLTGSPTVTQAGRADDPDAALRAKMLEPISKRLFGEKSGTGDLEQPARGGVGGLPASSVEPSQPEPDADQDLVAKQAMPGGTGGEGRTPRPPHPPRRPTASSRRRTSAARSRPPAHRYGPAAG